LRVYCDLYYKVYKKFALDKKKPLCCTGVKAVTLQIYARFFVVIWEGDFYLRFQTIGIIIMEIRGSQFLIEFNLWMIMRLMP